MGFLLAMEVREEGKGQEMEPRRRGPEKRRGRERREEAGTYQSTGHRGLVILRKMLLQGQDDAVGNDGGQDHVLKRRGKEELRNRFTKERATQPPRRLCT